MENTIVDSESIYLGLDLGTSGCKLIAFDSAGKIYSRASRDYQPDTPQPGIEELDAEMVWGFARECFHELALNKHSKHVKTLAISAQGEAFVLVDRDGRALTPAAISADMRGRPFVDPLIEKFGLRNILTITGHPPSPIHSIFKLMWYNKYQKESLTKAWKALCFGEYALLKLGLEPIIDQGMAARMMLFDLETKNWSKPLVEACGLSINQLPKIANSGCKLGKISDDIAADLKLPTNVEVILGGHDQPMGALGAGVIDPSMAIYSLGTTIASVVPMEKRNLTLCEKNIPIYPNVIPNSYVAIVGSQSGGRVLSWLRNILDEEGSVSFDTLLQNAQDIKLNNPILLPHFAGSGSILNDNQSQGVFYGLSFDTTRSQIISSALEGIVFEQAFNLNTLTKNTEALKDIRVIGGGSLSDFWMQMKADILNCDVYRMAVHDAPCLAAAILGRHAIEPKSTLQNIIGEMTMPIAHFSARPKLHQIHAKRAKIYQILYQALKPANKYLSEL